MVCLDRHTQATIVDGSRNPMRNQNSILPKIPAKPNRFTRSFVAVFIALLISTMACPLRGQPGVSSYGSLKEGQVIHGFKVLAIYLDNDDKPLGARFSHAATGLTLDLLEIQSVPQALIAVNTFPISDRGEPHTQEHL